MGGVLDIAGTSGAGRSGFLVLPFVKAVVDATTVGGMLGHPPALSLREAFYGFTAGIPINKRDCCRSKVPLFNVPLLDFVTVEGIVQVLLHVFGALVVANPECCNGPGPMESHTLVSMSTKKFMYERGPGSCKRISTDENKYYLQ